MNRYDELPHVDAPAVWPRGFSKWTPKHLFNICLYFACCLLAILILPNSIWDAEVKEITLIIGT